MDKNKTAENKDNKKITGMFSVPLFEKDFIFDEKKEFIEWTKTLGGRKISNVGGFQSKDFVKIKSTLNSKFIKQLTNDVAQAIQAYGPGKFQLACTAIWSNINGPDDHFDTEKSHFVPALISKVSKMTDGDTLELWGTGRPLRQQLYVDDLCRIIPRLLMSHNGDTPLIVAPDENLSIDEMAKTLISQLNKDVKIVYNNTLDGQFRKDGKNNHLKSTLQEDFEFTKFKDGVMKTYNWYKEAK